MSEHPITSMMETTLEKIRAMTDVNTIIGNPITLPDGTYVIPVSKVSFGFGSGGSDFPSKMNKDLFGGGAGAGVTIVPTAFLVVNSGDVKLLELNSQTDTADKIVNMVPEMFDKIKDLFKKESKTKEAE